MGVQAFALYALFLTLLVHAENTYTTRYDDVDLEEILANDRLLTGYIKCLMDEGPCTVDAKELKKNLPDAIENGCNLCSEKQREGSAKVMHYIIDNRPEDWMRLEKIYDLKGNYKKSYLESKNNSNEKGGANSAKVEPGQELHPTTEEDI